MTQVNHQYVFQSVVQTNVILAHLEILHIDPIVQIRVHVILLKTRNLDVRMPLQIKNQFFVILIIKYSHNRCYARGTVCHGSVAWDAIIWVEMRVVGNNIRPYPVGPF